MIDINDLEERETWVQLDDVDHDKAEILEENHIHALIRYYCDKHGRVIPLDNINR